MLFNKQKRKVCLFVCRIKCDNSIKCQLQPNHYEKQVKLAVLSGRQAEIPVALRHLVYNNNTELNSSANSSIKVIIIYNNNTELNSANNVPLCFF